MEYRPLITHSKYSRNQRKQRKINVVCKRCKKALFAVLPNAVIACPLCGQCNIAIEREFQSMSKDELRLLPKAS